MSTAALTLHVLAEPLAVSRLAPDAPLPEWAHAGGFVSHTRTADELSVICAEGMVPGEVEAARGWRALKLQGPLDFGLVGVLLRVAEPLARVEIGILPVGTYETDYVLVPGARLADALRALRSAGHTVLEPPA